MQWELAAGVLGAVLQCLPQGWTLAQAVAGFGAHCGKVCVACSTHGEQLSGSGQALHTQTPTERPL